MNNEPVAWIAVGDNTSVFFDLDCALSLDDNPTPLYTHPVKELTDYEIKGVMALDECWIGEDCSMPNMIEFARAILRKASEK